MQAAVGSALPAPVAPPQNPHREFVARGREVRSVAIDLIHQLPIQVEAISLAPRRLGGYGSHVPLPVSCQQGPGGKAAGAVIGVGAICKWPNRVYVGDGKKLGRKEGEKRGGKLAHMYGSPDPDPPLTRVQPGFGARPRGQVLAVLHIRPQHAKRGVPLLWQEHLQGAAAAAAAWSVGGGVGGIGGSDRGVRHGMQAVVRGGKPALDWAPSLRTKPPAPRRWH